MKIKYVKVQSQILKKVQTRFLNQVNDHHCHHFLEYYRHSPAEVSLLSRDFTFSRLSVLHICLHIIID